jgi:hypothetical protein
MDAERLGGAGFSAGVAAEALNPSSGVGVEESCFAVPVVFSCRFSMVVAAVGVRTKLRFIDKGCHNTSFIYLLPLKVSF